MQFDKISSSRELAIIDSYFSGEVVRGEDFDATGEERWYQEEAEAYGQLAFEDADVDPTHYPYEELNKSLGYKYIVSSDNLVVLGVGSAHGMEFRPIASMVSRFFVVESDRKYYKDTLFQKPATYFSPQIDGQFPIDDNSVDLITCFGVLHHICKPSIAFKEMSRVLRKGGRILIREPIISMGDFRKARKGLTKNERGIPLSAFEAYCKNAGLGIVKKTLIGHRAVTLPLQYFGRDPLGGGFFMHLDNFLCGFYSKVRYHRTTFVQKLSPTGIFLVLEKLY